MPSTPQPGKASPAILSAQRDALPTLGASSSIDVELAFLPARAWEPPALATRQASTAGDGDDDDADSTHSSSPAATLRFQLEPSTHGAVGDRVPHRTGDASTSSISDPAAGSTLTSSHSPEQALCDEEKKRLEQERKAKRRELLSRSVYVRGLPASMPQAEFAAMLLDCGPYNRVRICGNAPEGQNYLYGFVEFATTAGAEKMMLKSGTELQNGTERAPLRLDCTRVKRPIMDKVAEDADPDRGTPCTFGRFTTPGDGAVRTLGDVLHVVPPSVQAKAALRKGIERCACGCDGDSCCACCRCFSKTTAANNKIGSDSKAATSSSGSCCGGGGGESSSAACGSLASRDGLHGDAAVNVTYCSSVPRLPSAADLETLLSRRKEQLSACTQLLTVTHLGGPTSQREAARSWTALCDHLQDDIRHGHIHACLGLHSETPVELSIRALVVELVRLALFVALITVSLLLGQRRTALALPLLASLKSLLSDAVSWAWTGEQCSYASSIACFVALVVEPIDGHLALKFYQLAQTLQNREATLLCAESDATTDKAAGASKRQCLERLVANLSGDVPYTEPDANPSADALFDLLSSFFTGVASSPSGSRADATALPRWILSQVCEWKEHADALQHASILQERVQ